jgi:hypothetical protein
MLDLSVLEGRLGSAVRAEASPALAGLPTADHPNAGQQFALPPVKDVRYRAVRLHLQL